MARPRDDDVRRAAIEATIACIADDGIAALSTRSVARSIGVSTGSLSHHFGTKRNLLLEAIRFGYWHLPSWFGQRPAIESMRYVVRRYQLSTPKRRSWWRFWLAVSAHGQADAEIHELMLVEYRSIEDRWANAISRGQREGSFETDLEPREVAVRLAYTAHGIAVAQLTGALTVERAGRELADALDAICTPSHRSAETVRPSAR
jgi:AcrR family transcriptional regulator